MTKSEGGVEGIAKVKARNRTKLTFLFLATLARNSENKNLILLCRDATLASRISRKNKIIGTTFASRISRKNNKRKIQRNFLEKKGVEKPAKEVEKMILAIDVYYKEEQAKSVCIAFENWKDAAPKATHIVTVEEVEAYVPGEFYKRELPCILAVLEEVDLAEIKCIIVDGFVVLDDEGKYGLGGYLYEELGKTIPIIGVAKRGFHKNEKNVEKVLRGESQNPLFVTALGMDLKFAAQKIKEMHGTYRFPTLLKILDQETKSS